MGRRKREKTVTRSMKIFTWIQSKILKKQIKKERELLEDDDEEEKEDETRGCKRRRMRRHKQEGTLG